MVVSLTHPEAWTCETPIALARSTCESLTSKVSCAGRLHEIMERTHRRSISINPSHPLSSFIMSNRLKKTCSPHRSSHSAASPSLSFSPSSSPFSSSTQASAYSTPPPSPARASSPTTILLPPMTMLIPRPRRTAVRLRMIRISSSPLIPPATI